MALSISENSRLDGVQPKLTNRETEILSHISQGLSTRSIADLLFVSIRTVDFHVGRTYEKLGAKNRVQAILAAGKLGLIQEIPALNYAHHLREEL